MQPSFAGGEIAPTLHGRVDLDKYQTALRTCLNFQVHPHGGAFNRPGTQFVAACRDETQAVRLASFQFSSAQAYVLEFGDEYMRVIANGGLVTEKERLITAITKAANAKVTVTGHGYVAGDDIYFGGVTGMTQINGRTFRVVSVEDANNFTIDADSRTWGAFTGATGGTAAPGDPPASGGATEPPPPVDSGSGTGPGGSGYYSGSSPPPGAYGGSGGDGLTALP
jgi:hypothetical protein